MADPSDNQNVPSFLSQSPWYSRTKDGFALPQKRPKEKFDISQWYSKGAKVQSNSTKFRKGSCTNCGSMSHKVKECCERPRKVGAKYSGKVAKFDEVVEKLDLDYEAKHDRWAGYDPEMYKVVMNDYEKVQEAKKRNKIETLQENLYKGKDFDISDEEKNDEYAYSQMINNIDPRTKTITFNNRAREDRAGYLTNLDPENNNYDGKSRSLKEVQVGIDDPEQLYRDSWVKANGDMVKMAEQEAFIQKLNEKGNDLHIITNPSQAELLYKWHTETKKKLKEKVKTKLIEKYGDQQAED